jgi:hypothetical protein
MTLWHGRDGGLAKLSPEDQPMLAHLLYKNVYDAAATIVPQIRAVTTLGGLAANTSLTVGSATIEGDVRNSLSQERLAAFVDERICQHSLRGLGTWSQVDAAFAHWGEQFANRLAELQEKLPAD